MWSAKRREDWCGWARGLAISALCAIASCFTIPATAHGAGPASVQDGDGFLRATEARGAAQARLARPQARVFDSAVDGWSVNPIATPYPKPAARNAQVVYGGFVYNFGGRFSGGAGDNTNYVGRAQLLADGTIGPWQALTPLPMAIDMACVAIHGSWVYLLGGYRDSPSTTVLRAAIQADGTLGEWQGPPQLPGCQTCWYGHGVLIVGDVLYAYGGWGNSSIYASIIDAQGNLGPWTYAGELPVPLYSFAQCVWGNRLYLIGGKEIVNDVQTIVPTVRWVELGPDWPHGTWTQTNPMPLSAWFHKLATYGPNIYVVGAWRFYDRLPPEGEPTAVLHGLIGDDGSVAWDTTSVPPVPATLMEPGIVQDGGKLHCFGGFTSNDIYNLNLALDHTLTVTVLGQGTVARSPDQPRYGDGTTVTLTATPDPGWRFSGWSGDATGADPSVTVVMDGDKSVTATFCVGMAFMLTPRDLNLCSRDRWVTAHIWPRAPYKASEIEVGSLRLNGVAALTSPPPRLEWRGRTLAVRFARADVVRTLTPGCHVPVVLTGMVAGTCLSGTDYIRVWSRKVHHPHANDLLAAGVTAEVAWETGAEDAAASVTLLWSADDGATWQVAAKGVPNTGHYAWKVPGVATSAARLAVVRTDASEDADGTESELAASDRFGIAVPTGVEDGAAALALRPENPVTGSFAVRFSLASGAPAKLAVYDVSGREVVSRDVSAGGPGWHTARLGELPVGMYIVRLSQAGRTLSSRVAVVR